MVDGGISKGRRTLSLGDHSGLHRKDEARTCYLQPSSTMELTFSGISAKNYSAEKGQKRRILSFRPLRPHSEGSSRSPPPVHHSTPKACAACLSPLPTGPWFPAQSVDQPQGTSYATTDW